MNPRTNPEDDLAGSTVPSPARAPPQEEVTKTQELCQREQPARWPVQHGTAERSAGLVQREQRWVWGSQTHSSQDTGRGGTGQCGKGCSLSRRGTSLGGNPCLPPSRGSPRASTLRLAGSFRTTDECSQARAQDTQGRVSREGAQESDLYRLVHAGMSHVWTGKLSPCPRELWGRASVQRACVSGLSCFCC